MVCRVVALIVVLHAMMDNIHQVVMLTLLVNLVKSCDGLQGWLR